ncbi:hypothetical protein HJ01_03427 [Flavobacterium frigoris PS1]|uniref:Uncharacterized protein n=1 Tax=Flavobacterium frigoris (strain PS1) TaxID=1086011 RepID=H7FW80_FLAFP|nr:hypothetical protein HJ01_03427 [Flavobacterium frigoris PS1]
MFTEHPTHARPEIPVLLLLIITGKLGLLRVVFSLQFNAGPAQKFSITA